jgi:putative zinc finger protein
MNTEEARELLPWYAAGALSPAEAKAVETQLRQSPILRSELDEYRRLKEIVASTEDVPEFRPQLIQQTLAEIDALEQVQKRVTRAASASRGEGLFARIRQQMTAFWAPLPIGGRLAFAAQFAIILVLGGVLIGTQSQETEYVGASGPGPAVTAKTAQFNVRFQPEATEEAVRALLERVHLEIVAGPSAQQSYALASSTSDPMDAAATLKTLRESPIVRFAELAGH